MFDRASNKSSLRSHYKFDECEMGRTSVGLHARARKLCSNEHNLGANEAKWVLTRFVCLSSDACVPCLMHVYPPPSFSHLPPSPSSLLPPHSSLLPPPPSSSLLLPPPSSLLLPPPSLLTKEVRGRREERRVSHSNNTTGFLNPHPTR